MVPAHLFISTGATYWNKNIITGGSFLEHRMGARMGVGEENFKVGLGTMRFEGGGIGQRTGSVGLYGNNWSVHYENDWIGHEKLGSLPLGDGGDRWRDHG